MQEGNGVRQLLKMGAQVPIRSLIVGIVDRVIDVIGSKSDDLRPTSSAGGRDVRGISTVTHHNGVLVFILDVKRFTEIVENIADILPPYEG